MDTKQCRMNFNSTYRPKCIGDNRQTEIGKTIIKLKWLWKNKKDEDQTVIRNKARLVAKGYAQEEGIDFEESFSTSCTISSRKSLPSKESFVWIKASSKSMDSGFELTAFSDADHAGCINTRKSTSGGIQFLGDKLVVIGMNVNGIMPTKIELTLEQSQQGVSNDVLVSIEGVEE
ncbi:retrovirus-related pol polyprotein from transposon TNT 1-94 [Tanacetum coccineum]